MREVLRGGDKSQRTAPLCPSTSFFFPCLSSVFPLLPSPTLASPLHVVHLDSIDISNASVSMCIFFHRVNDISITRFFLLRVHFKKDNKIFFNLTIKFSIYTYTFYAHVHMPMVFLHKFSSKNVFHHSLTPSLPFT